MIAAGQNVKRLVSVGPKVLQLNTLPVSSATVVVRACALIFTDPASEP